MQDSIFSAIMEVIDFYLTRKEVREIRFSDISLPAPVAGVTGRTQEHQQICVEKLLDTFAPLEQVIPQILVTNTELEHYWWDKEAE